jgi:hypothetical protein
MADQLPDAGHDPYDFIMQGTPKPKRSLIPTGGSPTKRKIILGAGLFAILAFFAIVFILIFTSGGGSSQSTLELAQSQNEIIRITGPASTRDITSTDVAQFAQNTNTSMVSAQKQTLDYIVKSRKVPDAKELGLKQSGSTDSKLKTAKEAGQYDEVFYSILYQQLVAYKAQVEQDYKEATGKQQKALLQKLYNDVNTLLKNQTPPVTSS